MTRTMFALCGLLTLSHLTSCGGQEQDLTSDSTCTRALARYVACYGEPNLPGMPRHQELLNELDQGTCEGLTACYAACLLTVDACWECQFTDAECQETGNPLGDCVEACDGW